jgi:hypothetical protein
MLPECSRLRTLLAHPHLLLYRCIRPAQCNSDDRCHANNQLLPMWIGEQGLKVCLGSSTPLM